MKTAFKEWAVVVDALARGEQILILRKGGIHEGRDGFQVAHDRFWLAPTLFHQQAEGVVDAARERFATLRESLPSAEVLRMEYWGEVVSWLKVESLEAALALEGLHIWTGDLIRQRFDWGRKEGIYALCVRVHRGPERVELPMLPAYGGCKSWIELERDLPVTGSRPVLEEAAFLESLEVIRKRLEEVSV